MKKKSYLGVSFVLVFIFIFSFTIDARATNDAEVLSLQQVMGIQPDGDYAKADLATTPEGSVIMATVEDPSKIGGCLKGDRVKLINLGNEEWKITRLANGSGFHFTAYKEDGVTKINKTGTFGEKITPYGKKQNYMTFKAGIYSPESDNLENFDTGFNGEISIGHYLSPNAALEFGIGYFSTEWNGSGFNSIVGVWSETDEIKTVPFTLTLKGIAPFQGGEFYAGAGIGLYYVKGEADFQSTLIKKIGASDTDVTFGGNFLVGFNFNISQNAFIGIEGKYILAQAEFEGIILGQKVELDVDLDGFIGTFNIGFRF